MKSTKTIVFVFLVFSIFTSVGAETPVLDDVLDIAIYKPVGWIKKHPYISSAFAVAIITGVVYFYYFRDSNKCNDLTHAYILDKDGLTRLQPAQLLQSGLSCGYHSLWRYRCHLAAKANGTDVLALINDRAAFDKFHDECRAIEKSYGFLSRAGDLNDCALGKIYEEHSDFKGLNTFDNPLIVVNNKEMLQEARFTQGYAAEVVQSSEWKSYFLVNLGIVSDTISKLKQIEASGDEVDARAEVLESAKKRISHWIFCGFDLSYFPKPKVFISDSLGCNRTQDQTVEAIWDKVVKPLS